MAIATGLLSRRAGRSGRFDTIVLSRADDDELVDVERWSGRDELCHALETPVWDCFGLFAGQPPIAGTITWSTADRRVLIEGRHGDAAFDGLV
jgi:hypothetical protein